MSETSTPNSPRERILATALDLFYRQGYRATGINQIIGQAEVAKASFYDHFHSKEDLLVAYASEMARIEIGGLRTEVMALPLAKERFFGPLEILKPWLESSGYRGCPFQNVMADVPPEVSRVWEVARQHRESLRTFFRELTLDLKNSDKALSFLDPDTLASTYLIVFEGAIALCVAYRETWPVDQAKTLLCDILDPKEP